MDTPEPRPETLSWSPRRLFAILRERLALGNTPLPKLIELVAQEMLTEVCSVYVMRTGEVLELAATWGLAAGAVGSTRLRLGEGIVGLVAAMGSPINLADARAHPGFVQRPETGEGAFASLLAIPIRRSGHIIGVLTVQNREPRRFAEIEQEALETVAMLLAEMMTTAGAVEVRDEGFGAALPRRFDGLPLAAGIVIGPVVRAGQQVARRHVLAADPEVEQRRLLAASESMQRGLDELIRGTSDAIAGDASGDIMAAYRLIAADAGWLKRVSAMIEGGFSAEAAVMRVMGEVRGLPDVSGAILVARRLGPAELLEWHGRGIAGLVIEEGSAAGHAAILARSLGLPALSDARGVMDACRDGDKGILDTEDGIFILRPEDEVRQAYASALGLQRAHAKEWVALRDEPSVTADGIPVSLMVNLGLPLELPQLEATGAAGIGLYRTEISLLAQHRSVVEADHAAAAEGYLASDTLIVRQTAEYARVLDHAGERPVLFRTRDLGGDKILAGADLPISENPAMGWRSLRIGLDRPATLRRQLRALLAGAHGRDLSIMFPMVATVAEFKAARALLEAEVARVEHKPGKLCVGTMLEVPALLWQLPALMKEVDFLSVGSNDLMQFLFAADRGTPNLANRYDLISPPVLDLLESVVRHAVAENVSLSFCGEASGRPLEALILVALGFHSLSMSPSALPRVKAVLRRADVGAFRRVLGAIRNHQPQAASLREPLSSWAREHGLSI